MSDMGWKDGWAFPSLLMTSARKQHYFRAGKSLCGQAWMDPGAWVDEQPEPESAACRTCKRLLSLAPTPAEREEKP